MKKKKIFYAGDSPAGGPANYLLAILNTLNTAVTHIPPGCPVKADLFKTEFDVFIFSDYSYRDLSSKAEKLIAAQIQNGAGFLMIGGWGSFSGPFGGWGNSLLADFLPVNCLNKDDRVNISSGLLIRKQMPHAILSRFSFDSSPVICGFNHVRVKKGAKTLLTLHEMRNLKGNVKVQAKAYPFLIVSEVKGSRRAALTTDLAPHWCGGWVDWGKKHQKLAVTSKIGVEVGTDYIRFVQQLLCWLARA